MSYLPIENYGIIGNMRSCALIGTNGSIDWYCYPHFDSPSVFARILDDDKGGCFSLTPLCDRVNSKQLYWPETNILITRFLSSFGVGEILDFMPVGEMPAPVTHHFIVRRLRVVRGRMRFRMVCAPAFDYARAPHRASLAGQGVVFESGSLALRLTSDAPLEIAEGEGGQGDRATALFELGEGESVSFVFGPALADAQAVQLTDPAHASEMFEKTVQFWRRWLSRCTYRGRWREAVQRSALVLKLLTFEPSGAIVAAPTCSLPEELGGVRNWDYRYTWVRDAAFTLYGLLRIGFSDEAGAFMSWLDKRYREDHTDGALQIMYAIDGRSELPEETLGHLKGYRDSRPVHVGNGAYSQLQLDIYGELMDAVYLYNKYGSPVSHESWTRLRQVMRWLEDNWQRPDVGIWEARSGAKQTVHSKLMCWVAFDRALRLADKRSFPAPRERWQNVRDEIYESIFARGWSARKQAFTQAFDSEVLDASVLLMPLVFFVAPNDPCIRSTLEAIMKPAHEGGLVSDGLVRRYDVDQSPDGLVGDEGTFNMCSFWLVEALTRAGKTDRNALEKARLMFETILGYGNHLGLYAEETGPSGEALGNFPQAFTHLSLISAAFNLDRQLG